MFVKWLKLKNFRNYEECYTEFTPKFNLISGKNGQGKTNLVEAVMLCALTKSPRTSRDDDMRKDGSDFTDVELCVERNFGDITIRCRIDNQNKKMFFVNTNETKKMSDVFGNLVAVYFSPNDLKIVSGAPSDRRDFMDMDISELSGTYYNLIQRYNKILEQRNKLLKTIHNKQILESQIEIWNEQLASAAGHIVKTRKSFLNKITPPATNIMKYISKDADNLSISYVGSRGETYEEIRSEILSALRFNLDKDMELGYTTVGPHRDDIKFELDDKDSKIYASQGQQRTIALSVKIAELSVFASELGENPILVLDDVFSELDYSRQKNLYEKFSDVQILMTGTNFRYRPKDDYQQIIVDGGKLKNKMKYCKNINNN